MKLSEIVGARYTTKAFDPTRQISEEVIHDLIEVLRNSPSSVNLQPWHFVVAASSDAKERVSRATQGPFSYNAPKVIQASHVVVFCARTSVDVHVDELLQKEELDGRFVRDGAKAAQQATRMSYVNLHRFDQKDLQHWIEKQIYLSLGTLLLSAAASGIDATPMEGFDSRVLDSELGIRERGLTSVVLVALGYRSPTDFNASLPKSRLPLDRVASFL